MGVLVLIAALVPIVVVGVRLRIIPDVVVIPAATAVIALDVVAGAGARGGVLPWVQRWWPVRCSGPPSCDPMAWAWATSHCAR